MNKITRAFSFLKEVRGEIQKVVWPTRSELVGASIVVVILAMFFAVVLGAMDSGFGSAVKYIIGS